MFYESRIIFITHLSLALDIYVLVIRYFPSLLMNRNVQVTISEIYELTEHILSYKTLSVNKHDKKKKKSPVHSEC